LSHTVNFATGTQNHSNTAIDVIFADSTRLNSSSVYFIINGQFITINNNAAATNLIPLRQKTRKINKETAMQFQLLLKNKT
jgi:archaellum component FlaF (FlaF/FlaG flagellin family)